MEDGLKHTTRLSSEGIRRVKSPGTTDELVSKLQKNSDDAENLESPFGISVEYLTDNFDRQADGLRALSGVNDPEARAKRSLALLLRRKEILNSLQEATRVEPYTDTEREQLKWLYGMGSAFLNQISKDMNLFNVHHRIDAQLGATLSNLTTTEMQQNLAEMLISQPRRASDAVIGEGKQPPRFVEEIVLPLFNTMAVRAMGLDRGGALYRIVENGVYVTAAAYHIYSDPKMNKFNKSFKVVFPSPYLDAFEQTDLLLVDEHDIPADERAEIMRAVENMYGNEKDEGQSINTLSPGAKKFVYKVQIKSRSNGPEGLTAEEDKERERFASSRCKSKGFDNYDYLVLNTRRARDLIAAVRS